MKYGLLIAPLSLLMACGNNPAPAPSPDATPADASDIGTTADVQPPEDVQIPPRNDAAPCIIPQDLDGGLPNLIPRLPRAQVQIQVANFTAADRTGEIAEGCTLPGRRRLLRFTLDTPNIGTGDLYLGPANDGDRPRCGFEYSNTHHHYHLLGYADYRLFDMDGNLTARGHKQSFCFEDSVRLTTGPGSPGPMLPAAQQYGCGNMGIHHGWLDEYNRVLACQYIDITGVPAGHYRIHATINGLHTMAESDYTDNETDLEVDIPEDTDAGAMATMDPTLACAGSDTGPERDCGWTVTDSRGCLPDQQVTVGCSAACPERLGRCEGDSMIRVCPGDFPCMHAGAIENGENDDTCGGTCSQVTFTCPAGGRYTVMTAGHTAGVPAICAIESDVQALPPEM